MSMLAEIVKRIPSADRNLRSVGLVPASEAYGGGSAVAAFALGLVIGGGLALLYAPMSGREMRQRVREEVEGQAEEMRSH